MVSETIVREWLQKADEDYQHVLNHIEHENEFFAPFCFHCQQAAEKYLKAFLVAKNKRIPKIHQLKALLDLCMEIDPLFEKIRYDAKLLEPYYIDTRYPVSWPTGFSKEDAKEALASAKNVRNFVLAKLNRSHERRKSRPTCPIDKCF